MLTLMEEIILLALHEEKGVARTLLVPGLSAAILFELVLRNKIRLDEKIVSIQDPSPTGDTTLDEVIDWIQTAKDPQKIEHWYSKLIQSHAKCLQSVYERLVRERIVREEEKRIFLIFPVKRHPLKNKKIKRKLLDRIRAVVLRRHDSDNRMIYLLYLIQTCGWVRLIFEKDKRKEAKQRIKERLEKFIANEGSGKNKQNAIQIQWMDITKTMMSTINQ